MEYDKVVQYSALISDLIFRTKNNMKKLELQPPDFDVNTIRIRTARSTELIITTVSEYFMLVVQQCESYETADS
jgi:TRAP-type uncharacterized transport system substrate-binding protein